MKTTARDLLNLQKGLKLTLASVMVIIVAILTLFLAAGTAQLSPGVAEIGGSLAFLMLIGAGLLGLAGKVMALSTPVARNLVVLCLGLDSAAMLTSYAGCQNTAMAMSAASTAAFLVFLYRLGGYLSSGRLSSGVIRTVQRYFGGLSMVLLGACLATVSQGLMLFAMVFGCVLTMTSGLTYIRCLVFAQDDLLGAAAEISKV